MAYDMIIPIVFWAVMGIVGVFCMLLICSMCCCAGGTQGFGGAAQGNDQSLLQRRVVGRGGRVSLYDERVQRERPQARAMPRRDTIELNEMRRSGDLESGRVGNLGLLDLLERIPELQESEM